MNSGPTTSIGVLVGELSSPCLPIATVIFATVIAFLILLPPHHPKDGYMASTIDKHHLIDSEKRPKIVLVGGSNLAFGTDSNFLEIRTGTPVVNMGIHAGLGLKFMLDEVKTKLNQGDVVLIVPEFEQFNGMAQGRLLQHLQVLTVAPSLLSESANFERALAFAPELPGYLKRKLILYKAQLGSCIKKTVRRGKCEHEHLQTFNNPAFPPYSRNSFNAKGDVIAHLTMPPPGIADGLTIPKRADEKSVEILNSFHHYCLSKGVKTFICYASVPKSYFEKNAESAQQLALYVKKNIAIPAIASPRRYVLPDDCFFDTCYHLTKKGISYRMPLLAQDLGKALAN